MRGQGRVYRPTWTENGETRTASTWWIDYFVNGKRHKENAHTRSAKAARRLLRERIGAREAGKLTGNPDAVTLHDLRVLHEKQYELDACAPRSASASTGTTSRYFSGRRPEQSTSRRHGSMTTPPRACRPGGPGRRQRTSSHRSAAA